MMRHLLSVILCALMTVAVIAEEGTPSNATIQKNGENQSEQTTQTAKTSDAPKTQVESKEAAQSERKPASNVIRISESECLTDPLAIKDMQDLQAQLGKKEEELERKERELKARETALLEQISKLQELKKDIQIVEGNLDQKRAERVEKLVATVEKMSPKASSQLLAKLEDHLAIDVMSQISTPKLAKIMNNMQVERSSHLSEVMAGHASRRLSTEKKGGK